MAEQKNYIKSFIKEKVFPDGGSVINVSVNVESISALPKDKYGNVKVSIWRRNKIDNYDNTHYMVEDTYKNTEAKKEDTNQDTNKEAEDEDLPF